MIPPSCKRLAEVDFPIAEVSKHAVREKSIRHGHPCTLHLWWARRPLASCRAMLLALLLPDPVDEDCPNDFKEQARNLLPKVQGTPGPDDINLRQALLKFIGDFANWDLSTNSSYLEVSRGLVKAAHGEEPPLVVDPFAGGGSIPLEALRLGCDTFASDLNPVSALILKVMLEDIPRHGPELVDRLRRAGKEIKESAKKELTELYPPDPDGAQPIAYIWSRTVRCEAPGCGAEIPLVRSFWLSKKVNRKWALRYHINRPNGSPPIIEFEIVEPKSENEIPAGTVSRAKARCLACHGVLAPDRVRAQVRDQLGGADVIFDEQGKRNGGARLLAVVTVKSGHQGRYYRLPEGRDYSAVWEATQSIDEVSRKILPNGLKLVPDEPTPIGGGSGAGRAFSVHQYGMSSFGDMLTARQKMAMATLTRLIIDKRDDSTNSQSVIDELLALAVGRTADQTSSFVRWLPTIQAIASTFARPALSIAWDFCESCPLGDESANFEAALEWIIKYVNATQSIFGNTGTVQLADACNHSLPSDSSHIWFTDPPYYDAIPYSDLSDYFFIWFRRILPNHPLMSDPFDHNNQLTPKTLEIVQDETKSFNGRPKDRRLFEDRMAEAFAEGSRVLMGDGLGCVIFAHKSTEGWEALLSGIIKGGWTITGSWPIATERSVRMRARESAALATSIHLICRPRPDDASIGDWSKVINELPSRVGDWMEDLQGEGVRGADLVFACIGPALEIFSRYSKVETAEGREVKLPEYLEKVWEVVGRMALEQVLGTAEAKARNSAAGALEEDARLSALFLWTLQSTRGVANDNGEKAEEEPPTKKTRGYSLIFDVVRRFAQPLGIHLDDWKDRIIEIEKGVVRLIPVTERAKQLFGDVGAHVVADELERRPEDAQITLFSGVEEAAVPKVRGRRRARAMVTDTDLTTTREATTLDRIHAAMLLQKSGRTNALRALLKAEQDRSPDFLRLANALSALYPKDSEEKRLLDAMLLAVPR